MHRTSTLAAWALIASAGSLAAGSSSPLVAAPPAGECPVPFAAVVAQTSEECWILENPCRDPIRVADPQGFVEGDSVTVLAWEWGPDDEEFEDCPGARGQLLDYELVAYGPFDFGCALFSIDPSEDGCGPHTSYCGRELPLRGFDLDVPVGTDLHVIAWPKWNIFCPWTQCVVGLGVDPVVVTYCSGDTLVPLIETSWGQIRARFWERPAK